MAPSRPTPTPSGVRGGREMPAVPSATVSHSEVGSKKSTFSTVLFIDELPFYAVGVYANDESDGLQQGLRLSDSPATPKSNAQLM